MQTVAVIGRRAVLGALLGLVLLVGSGCGTLPATGPPPSPAGVHTVVFGSYAAPVLGVVVGPDLRVVDVDPGSAAERAGVRRGDVLTTIGSQALPAPGAAPAGTAPRHASPQARPSPTGAHITAKEMFRREVKPGQPLSLSVRRNGQPLDLQITPGGPGVGRFGGPTPTGVPQDSDFVYF